MLLAAPNGALLLSEPVSDSGPFVAGRHFAVARVEDMLGAVQHYLQHEDERSAIARSAQALVTQELTMAAMARRFLQAWMQRTGQRPFLQCQ